MFSKLQFFYIKIDSFPSFEEWHISLIFDLHYFFLSFVCVTTSWESEVVLLTDWVFSFIWAIFLRVVWVYLVTPFIYLTASTTLPMWPYHCHLQHLKLIKDELFHLLERFSDFYFFIYFRLFESQNVCIRLNFLFVLSDYYSFIICNPLFSQGCCYSSSAVAKDSSLLLRCSISQVDRPCILSRGKSSFWGYFRHASGCLPSQTNCRFKSFWQF